MLGLLNRLQIQLVFAAVNPQRRTHLRPDCFKDHLLQISHFYPHPMTRKIFCNFGVAAIKPDIIPERHGMVAAAAEYFSTEKVVTPLFIGKGEPPNRSIGFLKQFLAYDCRVVVRDFEPLAFIL